MPFKSRLKQICKPLYGVVKTASRPAIERVRRFMIESVTEANRVAWAPPANSQAQQPNFANLEPLMLSLIGNSSDTVGSSNPTAFALPLGRDLMLLMHPTVPFYLHHRGDDACVPWIALGQYEEGVSRFIRSHILPGESIIDADPAAGFHVLTMATSLCGNGRIIVPCGGESESLLRSNINQFSLGECLTFLPESSSRGDFLKRALSAGADNLALISLNRPETLFDDLRCLEPFEPGLRTTRILVRAAGTPSELASALDVLSAWGHRGWDASEINSAGECVPIERESHSPQPTRSFVLCQREES